MSAYRLSVVVPVKNEAGNIESLVAELERACAPLGAFEVIYVDDGSTDATGSVLESVRRGRPWLRVLRHARSGGQSAAVRATHPEGCVRLACVKPAASVRSEPGSNSQVEELIMTPITNHRQKHIRSPFPAIRSS
ncbi:hypothetical protein MHIMP23_05495 [Methylobacterium hispanicum]